MKTKDVVRGFIGAKKETVDIAYITIAYDNTSMINLLKQRGISMTSGNVKKFVKIEKQIQDEIVDVDNLEKL